MMVGINKMSDKSVIYSESRYKEIIVEVFQDIKKKDTLPIGAYFGGGWGNISNKPVTKHLDIKTLYYRNFSFDKSIKRHLDKPLKLPVQDVYMISRIDTILVGRIETGILSQEW